MVPLTAPEPVPALTKKVTAWLEVEGFTDEVNVKGGEVWFTVCVILPELVIVLSVSLVYTAWILTESVLSLVVLKIAWPLLSIAEPMLVVPS